MRNRILSIILLLLTLFKYILSTITPISIRNLDTINDRLSYYQFRFLYNQSIQDVAGFRLTFPPEIPLSLFESKDKFECYFKIGLTEHSKVDCDYNIMQEVFIKVSSVQEGLQSVSVGPIRNPSNIKGTANFKLCVMYNDYPQNCNDQFGTLNYNSKVINMKSATINQISSNIVSQGSSWLFEFELNGIYESEQYDIRVTFPKGFSSNNAGCQIADIDKRPDVEILFDQRQIECKSIKKVMYGKQQIKIINMVNPPNQISLSGFIIQILQSTTSQIIEEISFSTSYFIQAGTIKMRYESDNSYKFSNTTYAFYLIPDTALEIDTQIELKFGLDWLLYSQNCTVVRGLERKQGELINCDLDTYQNRYIISNYNKSTFENEILVVIPLQTPPYQGTYEIYANSLSEKDLVIDKGSLKISINSIYGSLQEFRVHPLQKQIKLKAGDIGPLEFTFFLKTKLPSTNYRSRGYFDISIVPKLIDIIEPTEGILKCFFFKNVISANCKFIHNGSSPLTYSKLRVYTPEDYDFQESEIPITITTEGSPPPRPDGIKLSNLVKRYLFSFQMYRQNLLQTNQAVELVEAYFQEWIPDPFEFEDARMEVLTTDSNEITHFTFKVVKFNSNSDLFTSSGKYLFKITFLNDYTGGPFLNWEFTIPENNNLRTIVEIPCLLYGNKQSPTAAYKCELVKNKYRDALKNQYGDPYIRVSIVDHQNILNPQDSSVREDFIIEIPNIQLGNIGSPTNLQAKLRFSFVEETIGMIDEFVEVYYKDFVFNVTPNQGLTPQPILNKVQLSSDNHVYIETIFNFQWDNGVVDIEYVTYEFDQSCFEDIRSQRTAVPLSTTPAPNNIQFSFGKKAQYVLIKNYQQKNTFQMDDIIEFKIRNCKYSDFFEINTRTFKKGRVMEKYKFSYIVEPNIISTYTFNLKPFPAIYINDIVRVNEEHQFYLSFKTITQVDASQNIIITVKNGVDLQKPSDNIFFCQVTISNKIVSCRNDTNQLTIYDFDFIPKDTLVEIDFRLLISQPNPKPLIDIKTVQIGSPNKVIDQALSKPITSPSTQQVDTDPNIDTPYKFQITPVQYRYELRPANYVGPLNFNFDVSNLPTKPYLQSIIVTLPIDIQFRRSTPLYSQRHPLKCIFSYLGIKKRYYCDYFQNTSNNIIITIYMNNDQLQQSTDLNLVITTEYVSPDEGFKHPNQSGFYPIDIEIEDYTSLKISSTRYIQIRGDKLTYYHITHIIRDEKLDNLYQFTFKTGKQYIPDFSIGGRIQFELPVKDNKNNQLFDQDLGHYSNGDLLGCSVLITGIPQAILNSIKCRIQNSLFPSNKVIIELISFPMIPALSVVDVYVARIKNPKFFNQNTDKIMDANIIVNIFNVNSPQCNFTLDNHIFINHYYFSTESYYYDYFNIFMDLRQATIHPPVDYTQTVSPWVNTVRVNQSNVQITLEYPDVFNSNDFYIIELPIYQYDKFEIKSCSTNTYICMEFYDINWVIIKFTSSVPINTTFQLIIKKISESIPRDDLVFTVHKWSLRRYEKKYNYIIPAIHFKSLMGRIYDGVLQISGQSAKIHSDKTNVPIKIKFSIENSIPQYGAIQIIFDSKKVRAHSHCRSSLTTNQNNILIEQDLQDQSIKSGSIGCRVETGYFANQNPGKGDENAYEYTSWVISGFYKIIQPGTYVTIYLEGFIDIIGNASQIKFLAYTYGNISGYPLIQYGRYIDSYYHYTASTFNNILNIPNTNLSFQSEKYDYLNTSVLPLRKGYRVIKILYTSFDNLFILKLKKTPLKMLFRQPAGTKVQAYSGRIRLRIAGSNQMDEQSQQILNMSESYACELHKKKEIERDEYIGCSIISLGMYDFANVYDRYFEFVIIPNTDIIGTQYYELVLTTSKPYPVTTMYPNSTQKVHGVLFNLDPQSYKLEIAMCQSCSSNNIGYTMWQHAYFSVYGDDFQKTELISFINMPGEWNIFTLEFSPSLKIVQNTDRLVIELPTSNIDGSKVLFKNDLGLTQIVENMGVALSDLIDCSDLTQSVKCTLVYGNYEAGSPAKFICYFQNDIAPLSTVKIAFTVTNPDNTLEPILIPIQVYIETIDKGFAPLASTFVGKISQWTLIEHAFYIDTKTNTIQTDSSSGIRFSSSSSLSACDDKVGLVFEFKLLTRASLFGADKDAYIFRIRDPNYYLKHTLNIHSSQTQYTTDSTRQSTVAILENSRAFIVYPHSTIGITAGEEVRMKSYDIHLQQFTDPNQKIKLQGYACYIQQRKTDKYDFVNTYPTIVQNTDVYAVNIFYDLFPRNKMQVQENIQDPPIKKYISTDKQDFVFKVNNQKLRNIKFNQWNLIRKVGVLIYKQQLKSNEKAICQEEKGSDIIVTGCRIADNTADPGYSLFLIDIAKTSITIGYLIFSTSYDAFQPIQTYAQPPFNTETDIQQADHLTIFKKNIKIKLYGENVANLNKVFGFADYDNYVCFISGNTSNTRLPNLPYSDIQLIPENKNNPSTPPYYRYYIHNSDIRAWYPYHRYIDEFVSCGLDERSPIKFEIYLTSTQVLTPSVDLTLVIKYGSDIIIPQEIRKTDYIVNKLLCYIQDERVQCKDNTATKELELTFQVAAGQKHIFVYVTSLTDNDITQDGVIYKGTSNFFSWNFVIKQGVTTIFTGYTSKFPIKLHPLLSCPYRVIYDMSVEYSTNVQYNTFPELIILEINMFFNPQYIKDISGLRILFPRYDEFKNPQYESSHFFEIETGGKYPCSRDYQKISLPFINLGLNCFIEDDIQQEYFIIHVINYRNVDPSEKIMILLNLNQPSQNYLAQITVQVFGGEKTFDAPYGQFYFGELTYRRQYLSTEMCISRIGTGACLSKTISKKIYYSNQLDQDGYYLFETNCIQGILGTLIIQVLVRGKNNFSPSQQFDFLITNCQNLDKGEPEDMCTFKQLNITNYSDFSIYTIQQLEMEEGMGSSYRKYAYIYIKFKNKNISASAALETVPVGLIQCRSTGQTQNGTHRFTAVNVCSYTETGREDSLQESFNNILYEPAYYSDPPTTITQSSIPFESLKSSVKAAIDTQLEHSNHALNSGYQLIVVHLKLQAVIPASILANIKYGYTLVLELVAANQVSIAVNMGASCVVKGGLANWDLLYYKTPITCEIYGRYIFIRNFSQFTSSSQYVQIEFQASNNAVGTPSIPFKLYLYQYNIKAENISYDTLSEYIFYISDFTVQGDFSIIDTTTSKFIALGQISYTNLEIQSSVTKLKIKFPLPHFYIPFAPHRSISETKEYHIQIILTGFQSDPIPSGYIENPIPGNSHCPVIPSKIGNSFVYTTDKMKYDNNNLQTSPCADIYKYSTTQAGIIGYYQGIYETQYQQQGSTIVHNYMASSVSIQSLSMSRNAMSELQITLEQPTFQIGIYFGYVLVLETRNNSIFPNIDSKHYLEEEEINCMCFNDFIKIADNLVVCMRKTVSLQVLSIHIYINDKQMQSQNKLVCYVPDFQNDLSTDNFSLKVIEPGLFQSTAHQYLVIASSYLLLTYQPQIATPFTSINFNSFDDSSIFITGYEITHYSIVVQYPPSLDQPYIILRQDIIGPKVDDTVCTVANGFQTVRSYSKHTNTVVCQSSQALTIQLNLIAHDLKTVESFPYYHYKTYNQDYKNYQVYAISTILKQTVYENKFCVTKKNIYVEPYNFSQDIKISAFYLSDNRGKKNKMLHALRFKLPSNFSKFDYRKDKAMIIIYKPTPTNDWSGQSFGKNCYSQSFEFAYSEQRIQEYPTDLRVHKCIMDNQRIIIFDEEYNFHQKSTQHRKFYVYFSIEVLQSHNKASFKIIYFGKYIGDPFTSPTRELNWIAAEGDVTMTYDDSPCSADLNACILPNNIRTFKFNIKRFINSQYQYRFYLYSASLLNNGQYFRQYLTLLRVVQNNQSFFYRIDTLNYLDPKLYLTYPTIWIMRKYGINGSKKNYVEKYLHPQITYNLNIFIDDSPGSLSSSGGMQPGDYIEIICQIVDYTQLGAFKEVGSSSNPFVNVVTMGYVNPYSVINFHDQTLFYQDRSDDYQTALLKLDKVYFTTQKGSQICSLFVQYLFTHVMDMPLYPSSYFELIFPYLKTTNIIGQDLENIQCQVQINGIVLTENNGTTRKQKPRCRIYTIEYEALVDSLLIRVEEVNFNQVIKTISFSIDNIQLPTSTITYQTQDLVFNYYVAEGQSASTDTQYDYQKFQLKINEIILIYNPTAIPVILPVYQPVYWSTTSTIFADKNVKQECKIKWPTQTQSNYNDQTSSGSKFSIKFFNGLVSTNDNTVENMVFYVEGLLQTPLWFNIPSNTVYFSTPVWNQDKYIQISVVANNLKAYQRDSYQNNGNTPIMQLSIYTGIQNTYSTTYHQLLSIIEINQMDFSQYKFRNIGFKINQIKFDNFATSELVKYQRATLKINFEKTPSIDISGRQVNQIRVTFDQGVTKVNNCYFTTPSKSKQLIDQICYIEFAGGKYSVNIKGIKRFLFTDNNFSIYVQLELNITVNILYQVDEIVDNPENNDEIEGQLVGQSLPITNFNPTTYLINQDFQEQRHFPYYYELYQVPLYANQFPKVKRIRFRIKFPAIGTVGTTDQLEIKLPPITSGQAYRQSNLANELQCFFLEELEVMNLNFRQHNIPRISECTCDGVKYYVPLPQGIKYDKYYVIDIHERYIYNHFIIPKSPLYFEIELKLTYGTTTIVDTLTTNLSNLFSSFTIQHFTTTQNHYDMISISFTPETSLTFSSIVTTPSNEQFLLVELQSQYFLDAFGLSESGGVYDSDDQPSYYNGKSIPCLLDDSGPAVQDCTLIVNQGQKVPSTSNLNDEQAPIQLILYKYSSFNPGNNYILYIPLVKMPSNVNTSIETKLSFIKIEADEYRILETQRWINYIHVQYDTSIPTAIQMSLTSGVVQTTSTFTFKFSNSLAITQSNNRALIKIDNNLKGINGADFKKTNIINAAACQYLLFAKINLIYLNQYTNNPTVQCDVRKFLTLDYDYLYGTQFTYINSIATSSTVFKEGISTKRLSPQSNDPSLSLTVNSGLPSQHSVMKLTLKFVIKYNVPYGSYIEITLPIGLNAYNERCYIVGGLIPIIPTSTNNNGGKYGSFQCQKQTEKIYVVNGFEAILSTSNVSIELFVQVTDLYNPLNPPKVQVDIKFKFNGQNCFIVQYAPINSPVVSNLGMKTLQIDDKIEINNYANEWQRLSFNFKNRIQKLDYYQNYIINLQFSQNIGDFKLSHSLADNHVYSKYLPNEQKYSDYSQRNLIEPYYSEVFPPLQQKAQITINFDLPKHTDQEYYSIDKSKLTEMMLESNTASDVPQTYGTYTPFNSSPIEKMAVQLPDLGYYVVYLYTEQNGNMIEKKYYDYISIPREDIKDNFKISPLTAEAGQKTSLILDFNSDRQIKVQDEIWIYFPTHDGQRDVFKEDLGLGFSSNETNRAIQCSFEIQLSQTDPLTVNRNCLLEKGKQGDSSKPARIRIIVQTALTQFTVRILLPSIENPTIVDQHAGITVQVRNRCSSHGTLECIVYHAQHSYQVISPFNNQYNLCYFIPQDNFVGNFVQQPTQFHQFDTPPVSNPPLVLPSGSYVIFMYPDNHKDSSICFSTQGICLFFSDHNLVILKLSSNFSFVAPYQLFKIEKIRNGMHRAETSTQSNYKVYFYDQHKILSAFKCSYWFGQFLSQIPSKTVCGYLTNTQTIVPTYFLRENYVNVAELRVYGLFRNEFVNYYRIQKDSKITQLIQNYCHASLSIPLVSGLSPNFEIPLQCNVYDEFIIINRIDNHIISTSTYNYEQAWISLFFKFIVDGTIPTVIDHSNFKIFGCVGTCFDISNQFLYKYHQHSSYCQVDFDISDLKQPNLAIVGFYTKPYYLRSVMIYEPLEFQILIRPRTNPRDYIIDRLVFEIPDEFKYPSLRSFDNCLLQGTVNSGIQECSMKRNTGSTQMTVIPLNYNDNSVKIVTLSNKQIQQLFIAPEYPGSHYLMKVELYSGPTLVETQYMNVTEVLGVTLQNFYITNSLDQETNQIFEFNFKIAQVFVPKGYLRTQYNSDYDGIYSKIKIYFEWVGGGWNIHRGYLKDLGTGLPNYSLLGCNSRLRSPNKLRCVLIHGVNAEKMPHIEISGYEEISPNTEIKLFITNIRTLNKDDNSMTVKVGIETIYEKITAKGYLYQLMAFIPKVTRPILVLPPSATSNTIAITITYQTSVEIYGYTSYQIKFINDPLLQLGELVGLFFPKNFIGKNQDIIATTTTANEILIFPESDSVYIICTSSTANLFEIKLVSNPDFQMLDPVNLEIKGFVLNMPDRQIRYKAKSPLTSAFIFYPFSKIPYLKVETIQSIQGGEINVSYLFSFVTGHFIPSNGSISITFPTGIYNDVLSMWKGCSISGGIFEEEFNQSYCTVEIGNRVDIILVDTLLTQNNLYQLLIHGITNPNVQNLNAYKFTFQSFYTNQPSLNQVIGEKQFDMPFLLYFTPFACNLEVETQYRQALKKSIYTFAFRCQGLVKHNSDLWINIPYQYGSQNNIATYQCSSSDEDTLYKQYCILDKIDGQLKLKVQVKQILPMKLFNIKVQLTNPSSANKLYQFTADFLKNGFRYANSLSNLSQKSTQIEILPGNSVIQTLPSQSNVQITLQNIPQNSGEPSTYVFMIPQVKELNTKVLKTEIVFPSIFAANLGTDLSCSLFQSDQIGLQFTYEILLQIRTNTTDYKQPYKNYYSIDCQVQDSFILTLTGMSEYLGNSNMDYNYIIINNLKNPGNSAFRNFRISHLSDGQLLWVFDDNLNYKILNSPDLLDVISITPAQLTINHETAYTFKLKQKSTKASLSTFGLLIKVPQQYNLSNQPLINNCKAISLSNKESSCKFYREYILIKDTSANINNMVSEFKLEYLTNPSSLDPCNQYSSNKYFTFQVLDLSNNLIITASRDRFSMKVVGSTNFVRGLSYTQKIEIEKPADCLSLEPYTEDQNIKFNPSILKFENYQQTTLSFEILVKYGAQLGEHYIRFKKQEYTRISESQISLKTEDIYSSPPSISVKIQEFDEKKQMRPSIVVEDFMDYGVYNSTFIALCSITKQSSEPFNFEITYNRNLQNMISIKPESILILPQTKNFNFTIRYLQKQIIDPIQLFFKLYSLNSSQLIHQVQPSSKWLVFVLSQIHYPSHILKVIFQDSHPSSNLYKLYLGKQIISQDTINDTKINNLETVSVPQILQCSKLKITEYSAQIRVLASFSSTIYYILTMQNSFTAIPVEIRDGIYQKGKQLIHSFIDTNRSANKNIDYYADIDLLNLKPDIDYSLYLVCQNSLGLSKNVFAYNFSTSKVSQGVIFSFSLKQPVILSTLLKSISMVLRIPQDKITLYSSEDLINNQIQRKNENIKYEIIISPIRVENVRVLDYIKDYITDKELFNLMAIKFIPEFIISEDGLVNIYLYSKSPPKFQVEPILTSIEYYDASIQVQMWDLSKVYVQVVEKQQSLFNTGLHTNSSYQELSINSLKDYVFEQLLSQQIILGIDQRNEEINPNWVISALTDPNTFQAIIKLDDLKDGTNYDVYISATNIMPYSDFSLYSKLPNEQVKKISFRTSFNYNIDECQMLRDLYSFNQDLAKAVQRRIVKNPANQMMCITILQH